MDYSLSAVLIGIELSKKFFCVEVRCDLLLLFLLLGQRVVQELLIISEWIRHAKHLHRVFFWLRFQGHRHIMCEFGT